MIMDDRLEFADAVSVAGAAGTALIGDVINLGAQHRDIGAGEPLFLAITCDTAFLSSVGAGTVKFQLVSDAQAAIATDGSASVHFDTGTFATATANPAFPLRAGDLIAMVAIPQEGRIYEQFLGILCVIATNAIASGKINAFLTKDPSALGKKVYAENP